MALSHYMVCRNWLSQSGKNSRGFNMFADGELIFSYGRHFPAARIIGRIVLMRCDHPSVSTAKHLNHIFRASLIAGIKADHIWHVPFVTANDDATHGANVLYLLSQADEMRDRAKRARKHGESYMQRAEYYDGRANAYALAFLPHQSLKMAA